MGHRSQLRANHLLRLLPSSELARVERSAVIETFAPGDVTSARGDGASVRFPLTGVFALLAWERDGGGVFMAMVGCEGAVGVNESLGSPQLALDRMCVVGGTAARLPVPDFIRLLEVSARFNRYVMRYLALREAVIAQMVVCSRFHPLSSRLARLLLAAHIRTGGRPLLITHDRLALLVGASRPKLSAGLDGFREAGLIDTRPGEIEFLDTAGLRREACYCYELVRQTYAAITRLDAAPA